MSEPGNQILIPVLLWRRAILDLRRRGAGKTESGAFLLGWQNGRARRVTKYICYDDLDPHAHSGGITFHAIGYAALWRHCKEKNLEVLADVHTHPACDVRQSSIDQHHPMVPTVGHMALIVPNFARTHWRSLEAVGVYEYLGNFQWRTHATNQTKCQVRLTIW